MTEKPHITRFEYQRLYGYLLDENGEPVCKVFEGKAVLSDGSTRIIFGKQSLGNDVAPIDHMINWDTSAGQERPKIDRNAMGLHVKEREP